MSNNAIANMTDYDASLKLVWEQEDVQDAFINKSPTLAFIPKNEEMSGKGHVVVVDLGGTNGASADFASARAAKKSSKTTSFTSTPGDYYGLFSIDQKLIATSKRDKGAVLDAIRREPRKTILKIKERFATHLWGNSGGSLGKIAAISTNTITLSDPRNARNFKIGDSIDIAPDDGSTPTAVRTGTSLVVAKTNRAKTGTGAGVITFETNVTTNFAGAIVGDFLFAKGDYGKCILGIPAWIPSSDPGTGGVPTSILGMDRSPDLRTLGGIRVPATGLLPQEAAIKLLGEMYDEGAEPTHLIMQTERWQDLLNSLGSQKRYVDAKIGGVGFTGFEFSMPGSGKMVEAYAEPNCPINNMYALDFSEDGGWTFGSTDPFPAFFGDSGIMRGQYLRVEDTTNSLEGRIGGFPELYCECPGRNGVAILG